MSQSAVGTIFNVQRFSLHDGPGMRDLIFLKGCPLRCEWCADPESQHAEPELSCRPAKCIGCRACARICAHGAPQFGADGKATIDTDKCVGCKLCTKVCPRDAILPIATAEEKEKYKAIKKAQAEKAAAAKAAEAAPAQ